MRHSSFLLIPSLLVVTAACSKPSESISSFRGKGTVVIDGRRYDTFDVSDLGSCVTLDNGSDDNNALKNVRSFLTNDIPHQSIATARDNLNGCAGIGTADLAIVGHGTEGAIFVGGGQNRESGKFVGSENNGEWEPLLRSLTAGTGHLSLLSCNTGSDVRGAKLLNRLTSVTKRPVRALNGIAYFEPNTILLEAGVEWNLATPEKAAAVRPRPTPPYAPFAAPSVLTLGKMTFPVDSIRRFNIAGWSKEIQSFDPTTEQRRSFLQLIDFEHPFEPPGVPLAPVTARIEIETTRGAKRTVIIYGDVLAQDALDKKRFFDIDPEPEGGLEKWAAH